MVNAAVPTAVSASISTPLRSKALTVADRATADRGRCLGRHRDLPARDRDALGLRLRADVDHARRTVFVEMRERRLGLDDRRFLPRHYSTVTDFARLRG